MPRILKPNTPGTRQMSYGDFETLTKKRPAKSLTINLRKHAGRDNTGSISVRHRGGGSKRLYRMVDFRMLPFEGKATIQSIEYDPNRSAFIALAEVVIDGVTKKFYLLAPHDLKAGDTVTSGQAKQFNPGSRLKLADIPAGSDIHNLELNPGQGGKMIRAAGTWGTLTAKEGKYAYVRMPSSEVRKVLLECMASVGRVSNPTHNRIRIAKAGRSRNMGIRPSVRGKAMNPNSHPHGGGEGVNPIGMKHPKTPWGKPALGYRTRRNKRTDKFIINRRKK
jgi:large subunit ribosomal protein L2